MTPITKSAPQTVEDRMKLGLKGQAAKTFIAMAEVTEHTLNNGIKLSDSQKMDLHMKAAAYYQSAAKFTSPDASNTIVEGLREKEKAQATKAKEFSRLLKKPIEDKIVERKIDNIAVSLRHIKMMEIESMLMVTRLKRGQRI